MLLPLEPFDFQHFFRYPGWYIEEEDEQSLALTEIDLSKIRLIPTMLREGEESIEARENRRRLKEAGFILLDARIYQALLRNPQFYPESWVKTPTGGKEVFFDGTLIGYRDEDDTHLELMGLYWDPVNCSPGNLNRTVEQVQNKDMLVPAKYSFEHARQCRVSAVL